MKKTNTSLIRHCILAGIMLLPGMAMAETMSYEALQTNTVSSYYSEDDKAEVAKYLLVWDNQGGTIAFPLEERPRIVTDVKNQMIKFVTTKQVLALLMNEVHKYTLSATSGEDTAIDDAVSDEGSFGRNNNELIFQNFKTGSVVSVYTVNGMMIQSERVDADGRLTISMEGWNAGIYIIKTESATYKIIKK